MYSLDNFYQSRIWRNFLQELKLERVNEDGQIICEYCNKPIVKSYDIIGHHKIYLTEENVNDFEISLNPENVAFVHHRCHNLIHNKLNYSHREVYLIYGSPCSGKSTFLSSVVQRGDLIVDVDRIRQCVSGQETHIITPALNTVVFGIRNYLMDCVKYRTGKWTRAYIIGGFPLVSERERIINETGARDIYIEATKEECLERLHMSPDFRNISEWEKYIEDWWMKFDRCNPDG